MTEANAPINNAWQIVSRPSPDKREQDPDFVLANSAAVADYALPNHGDIRQGYLSSADRLEVQRQKRETEAAKQGPELYLS